MDLGDFNSRVTSFVKNLCVLFDSGLKFDKQINSVVKSCFFHLQRLAKVKIFSLSKELSIIVIHLATRDKRSETIPPCRISPDPSDSQIHVGAASRDTHGHSCSRVQVMYWDDLCRCLVLCSVTHFLF